MTSSLESYAIWLADYYLLATLLLAGALSALATVIQPAHKLAIAKSSLVALSLLAGLTVLPGWSLVHLVSSEPAPTKTPPTAIQRPPSDGGQFIAVQLAPAEQQVAADAPQPNAETNAPGTAAPASTGVSWLVFFAVGHLFGVAIVAMWLVAGFVAARRLLRRSTPASQELAAMFHDLTHDGANGREPQLRISDDVDVPAALGILRPCVLLPAQWSLRVPLPHREGPGEGSPRDDLRTVLAHEAAHLHARDLHWLAASRVLNVVLWAQPLYWFLRRRMRLDQEALADAAAAEWSSRERYAEQLVAWAHEVAAHPTIRLSSAVGLWEGPSQLRRRIAMLVDERFTVLRTCSQRWKVSVAAAVLVTATTLSSVTLQPLTEAAEEPNAAATKENAAESLDYSGTVVDKRNGRPIAGAKVVVKRQTSSKYPWPTLAETEHVTAADGTYQFTIPPEQVADKKLYIELDVTHSDYAPRTGFGYALGMIRKNEKLGGRPYFDRVELEPAAPITGLVKTPNGEAATKMPILAYSKADPKEMSEYGSFARGETDADGRFRLNVTRGGHAILWLLPGDYSQETHVLNDRRGDLGSFDLKLGVRLRGQVVDRDGKAIPSVWVNAKLREGPAKKPISMPVADQIDRSALTDENGRFELGPLPPGSYRVLPEEYPEENPRHEREPHPLPAVFVPQRVSISPDEQPTSLQIQAVETVTIEAQIFDSAGKPRTGHEVDFFGRVGGEQGEFYHAQGRPDQNGQIVLKVPKGISGAELQIIGNEHQVLRYGRNGGPDRRADRKIEFGTLNTDQRGFEIYYYTAPIVIVAARDTDGKPISDFKPAIFYRQGVKPREVGTRWISGVEGEVNFEHQEDGRWRSEQLLPDEEFILTVIANGYQTAAQTLKLGEGEVKEIEVPLTRNTGEGADEADTSAKGVRSDSGGSVNHSPQPVPIRLVQNTSPASSKATGRSRPPALISYGDGKADGKKSYGGSGHFIKFTLPEGVEKVRGLRIHGSRYGHPQAPDEDFEITFLSEDRSEILHSESAPYHLFKRGKEQWVRVMFDDEIELPETFWVALNFNAHQTKGVYLSYDTSTGGEHSRVGLPGDEEEPKETDFGGDWMVQLMLPRPGR